MKPDGNTDKRGQDMGPNFREILPILVQNDVRFIVIGGVGRPRQGLASGVRELSSARFPVNCP